MIMDMSISSIAESDVVPLVQIDGFSQNSFGRCCLRRAEEQSDFRAASLFGGFTLRFLVTAPVLSRGIVRVSCRTQHCGDGGFVEAFARDGTEARVTQNFSCWETGESVPTGGQGEYAPEQKFGAREGVGDPHHFCPLVFTPVLLHSRQSSSFQP